MAYARKIWKPTADLISNSLPPTNKHDLLIGQLYNWFLRYNFEVVTHQSSMPGADLEIANHDSRVLIEVNRRWYLNKGSQPNVLKRHGGSGVRATIFVTPHPEALKHQLAALSSFAVLDNLFVVGEDEFSFLLPPLVLNLLGLPKGGSGLGRSESLQAEAHEQ